MASGDVIFEIPTVKLDSFSAEDFSGSVSVKFSFGSSSGPGSGPNVPLFNGQPVQVVDSSFVLNQSLNPYYAWPNNQYTTPIKIEADSPFEAGKQYKIQIVEV